MARNGDGEIMDYQEYYEEISEVVYHGNNTIVKLIHGHVGVAILKEGDVYDKDKGFWIAYAKALREFYSMIKDRYKRLNIQ